MWGVLVSDLGGEEGTGHLLTCKAIGVDLQAYIPDVIARIAGNWPA